jgi:molybdopterin-containing oxidoreductase family iron-sulfur binding subunit
MDRREFLKATGGLVLVGASSAFAVKLITDATGVHTRKGAHASRRKWGMVIDLNKCRADCTACLEACRHENNVGHFGDPRWDVHWIRKVKLENKGGGSVPHKPVPLLCNHCDKPPCAQVCPVQATYKREDGIVIVDHHRCIGCRYCMIACPYNARFFNFREAEEWHNKEFPKRSHGVAESCTLCAHLLEKNEQPACVQACARVEAGALTVGDLNDPYSDVSQLIASNSVKRLREDLGTEPKVHYIGL